jgi:hypothetical protein
MKEETAKRLQQRIERRYERADKKIEAAKAESLEKYERVNKKYGYNYEAAEKAGIKPDETGHWASRNPDTGEILKGNKHPTMPLTKRGEKEAGYKMYRKDGKWFSKPR